MVIGLDIDDTITRHPEFFSFLSRSLIQAGHKVIIITFRENRVTTEEYLKQCNIHYSELVTSSLDSCFEYGINEWKSAMCRKHNVDILFDDDPKSIQHVDETTLCLMPVKIRRTQTVRS